MKTVTKLKAGEKFMWPSLQIIEEKKKVDLQYTVIKDYEHYVLVRDEYGCRRCITHADLIVAGMII